MLTIKIHFQFTSQRLDQQADKCLKTPIDVTTIQVDQKNQEDNKEIKITKKRERKRKSKELNKTSHFQQIHLFLSQYLSKSSIFEQKKYNFKQREKEV